MLIQLKIWEQAFTKTWSVATCGAVPVTHFRKQATYTLVVIYQGLAYARFVQGKGTVPVGTQLSAIPGIADDATFVYVRWKLLAFD